MKKDNKDNRETKKDKWRHEMKFKWISFSEEVVILCSRFSLCDFHFFKLLHPFLLPLSRQQLLSLNVLHHL